MGICFLQSILLQRYELASISCILRDNFKLKELALPATVVLSVSMSLFPIKSTTINR